MPDELQKEKRGLDLKEQLALNQTTLSNDRTLLSFTRGSLMFVVMGLTLIKFFNVRVLFWLGWVFMGAAPVLLTIGYIRHRRMYRNILSQVEEHKRGGEGGGRGSGSSRGKKAA